MTDTPLTHLLYQALSDWRTDVAAGRYVAIDSERKFGSNALVGTTAEDVWNVGGAEILITSAVAHFASCEDNVNGIGQVLRVEGLDANWNVQLGRVTLNGNTAVEITKDDGSAATWIRIHRAFQLSAAPDPVGDVWIAESDTLTAGVPDTATKIHAKVVYTPLVGQTEKALFTVPRGHVAFFHQVTGYMIESHGADRSATMSLEVANLAEGADISSPSWAPRRTVDKLNLSFSKPNAENNYVVPLVYTELTNIHLKAAASANSNVFGSFSFILLPFRK